MPFQLKPLFLNKKTWHCNGCDLNPAAMSQTDYKQKGKCGNGFN